MVSNFHLPPTGYGPGSQPEDDDLQYMSLPQDMRTFSPRIPEVDDTDALAPAMASSWSSHRPARSAHSRRCCHAHASTVTAQAAVGPRVP